MYLFNIFNNQMNTLCRYFILSSFMFLTFCTLPSTQKKNDSSETSSSFYVDELSGIMVAESFKKEISLPSERVYSVKACLKDLKYQKPITNHPFFIEELNQEVKSDVGGCLNWKENIKFEFLSKPQFLKFERKIQSRGLHTGTYKISFAVNPWDTDTYKEIIDLSKKNLAVVEDPKEVENSLKGLSQDEKYDLWAEDGRLFVTENEPGKNFSLKYDFSMTPNIKLKKTSNEFYSYNLKYGTFSGTIEVIQKFFDGEKQKNSYEILSYKKFENVEMKKGLLAFSEILDFQPIPSRGTLLVRLTLRPSLKLTNLANFKGIYPIGGPSQIRSNQFLKVDVSYDENDELEKVLPWKENLKFQSPYVSPESDSVNIGNSHQVNSHIYLGDVSLNSVQQVQQIPERNFMRKVDFTSKVCLEFTIDPSPVKFQKFKVITENEHQEKIENEITTDKNGCLNISDKIEFNIYSCQKFLKRKLTVINKALRYEETRNYYINPWKTHYDSITDSIKIVSNPNTLSTSCDTSNPILSEFVLNNAEIVIKNIDTNDKIDNLLDLTSAYHINLVLNNPQIKIGSDSEKGTGQNPEYLIDGVYLLRVLIVKNINLHPNFEVLYFKEIPVAKLEQKITADLNLFFEDRSVLSTKNTLFLQLLPIYPNKVEKSTSSDAGIKLKDPNTPIENLIDPNTDVVSPIFSQEFIPIKPDTINLVPYSGSRLPEYLKIAGNYKAPSIDFDKIRAELKLTASSKNPTKEKFSRQSIPENYAISHLLNFTYEDKMSPLPFANWVKYTLHTRKFNFNNNTSMQLCKYWYDAFWKGKFNFVGSQLIQNVCSTASEKNIKSFFNFSHVYFIKEISTSKFLNSEPETPITLGSDFSISESFSDVLSGSWNAGLTASAQKSLLGDFLSIGSNIGYGVSVAQSNTSTTTTSKTLSRNVPLKINTLNFQLESTKYQYCIEIKPNPRLFRDTGKIWYKEILDRTWDFSQFFKSELSEEEKTILTQRGILFCQSKLVSEPFQFNEKYYWVTHTTTDNEVNISSDESNKIFNIMIRGQEDFNRFNFFLTQNWEKPDSATQKSEYENYLRTLFQFKSYDKMFPGVYLLKEK